MTFPNLPTNRFRSLSRSRHLGVALALALAVPLVAIPGSVQADPPPGPRNLALNRAVVHSAAKNYNETGHRATDGLYTAVNPSDPRTDPLYSASDGVADNAFDGDRATQWTTTLLPATLTADLPAARTVTRYKITASVVDYGFLWATSYPVTWELQGSNDGLAFAVLDARNEPAPSGFDPSIWLLDGNVFDVATPGSYQYYRLSVTAAAPPFYGPASVAVLELDLLGAGGESYIPSAGEKVKWSATASSPQSIVVDLGAPSTFSEIKLFWESVNYATAYSIDTSADGDNWVSAYATGAGDGYTDAIALAVPAVGQRYVRLTANASSGTEYALQEIEVWGENELEYTLPAQPSPEADGTQYLTGGNWKLRRAGDVPQTGAQLATAAGAAASAEWLPATVPGTALTSYLNAGAVVDANFSDYQLQISDSFFTADWWYTNHFTVPASERGQRTWLNFDAINWKANIYFNGTRLGPRQGLDPARYDIEGAYTPGKFDVTDLVDFGGENYLAVFIKKNDTPGAVTLQDLVNAGGNGGALGADNPTIHASIGWDWVPTIRGRNIGIYEDVYLSYSQDVRIENPWVVTDLDLESGDLSSADLTIRTELVNPTSNGQNVVVSGSVEAPVQDLGSEGIVGAAPIEFTSASLYVPAKSTVEVLVDRVTVPNPQLWWPNGYGEQPLYSVEMTARTAPNVVSDRLEFKIGVREYAYELVDDAIGHGLNISVNGVRVVARGGNWGMSDSNMAATAEDYDLKMRLHADENFNMVRNWVGMTGHRAFYDAADKYGIMIWDDFWLANPYDGPNPNDENMFEASAIAKIKRVRSHAAVALYCGRNEGSPPATVDAYLRKWTRELDGTRTYVSDSASPAEGTGGHGPYGVRDPNWYYVNTPAWAGYNGTQDGAKTLSSERGQLNIPTLESMHRMFGDEIPWPPNDLWGIHDFTTGGATEAGVSLAHIENTYDPDYVANGVEEYVATAQLMNYDNHKGVFEPVYVNDTPGLVMWMSQSAWPSTAWQTYDYYYDLNAGYYGIKKANQPVNAIYNVTDEKVYLSNETVAPLAGATVTVEVWGLDGLKKSTQSVTVDASVGSQNEVLTVARPDGLVGERFIRTFVNDGAGTELSSNFYWTNPDVVSVWPEGSKTNRGTNRPTTWADHKALRTALKGTSANPVAPVELDVRAVPAAGSEPGWAGVQVTLTNPSASPSLLTRIKGVDENGEQILPFIVDDNYVTLMPGETVTLSAKYKVSGRAGAVTRVAVDGFNAADQTVSLGTASAGQSGQLAALVTVAEGLPRGTTPQAAWSAFAGALAAAQAVLGTPGASQVEIDQAQADLRWAIADLQLPAPADLSGLAGAIDRASALGPEGFTPASWQGVAAALAAARAVAGSSYPVQEAADGAARDLLAAVAGLETVPAVDAASQKAALSAVIDVVEAAVGAEGGYTAESWAPYAEALDAARAALTDPASTPARVTAAQAAVTSAFASLVRVRSAPANSALLAALIETAQGRLAADYTPETWSALAQGLAHARAVAANPAASEAEIAQAIVALSRAESGLARIEPGSTEIVPIASALVRVKAGQGSIVLVRGKTATVAALGYDSTGAASKSVRWTTSNSKVVKVNKTTGKLRAVGAGKATVKAASALPNANGKYVSATVKVTVVAPEKSRKATKVTANVPKTLKVGATKGIVPKVAPASATGAKVAYTSSRPSVLKVDKAGTLTGVKAGQATVTVKAGGRTAKYKVQVG